MKIGSSVCTILLTLCSIECFAHYVSASSLGTDSTSKRVRKSNKNVALKKTPKDIILKNINNFQNQYFKIIKRHDVLLSDYVEDEHIKDAAELDSLLKEIEDRINKDDPWFKKYMDIKTKFESNSGETTYDMMEFEGKHYAEVDKLLNNVFVFLKSKLNLSDFKRLRASQRIWLKEVREYEKVFDSKELGSMGALKTTTCEINMRNFRILLLILCAQQKEKAK